MATYNKYQDAVEQLCKGLHHFGTDVFKAWLSNVAPTATDTAFPGTATEFTPGGTGYTTGGSDCQLTCAESGGTATVTGTKVTWTAAGTDWNTFRYVGIYNDTNASNAVWCYFDYGVGGVTLKVGETFSIKFNGSESTGTLFTLA